MKEKNEIQCNVKNCIYNERGCSCNLERVSISKGSGKHHYCKSYLPLNEEEKQDNNSNVESGEEYFDFNDFVSDITVDISDNVEE